ncbi:MAG TPA: SRPBCC domain-containing protein [Candidatus Binataceae bacterium]|nr:SRPBCC domain-containing protein [Candidatus Binataceae bacterium]
MIAATLKTARAIANLKDGVIVATVEIAASPERVFRALTTAELAQWWGEEGDYRVTAYKADLRVGGAWISTGRSADGTEFSVSGTILEIEPPRRLVQTWKYDWEGGGETTLTYQLESIEGGTRLTARHEGFTDPKAAESHAFGWEKVLGWLVAHLGRNL